MNNGARILYIEDDPGLSRLVRARLEAEGYRVELCETGVEGLAAFDEALHDLVIVDYQLPDYNGLQVLEMLMTRGVTTPVIIATGAGSEEIAVRAMKLGAADYINKEASGKFFHLLPSLVEKTMRQHELQKQTAACPDGVARKRGTAPLDPRLHRRRGARHGQIRALRRRSGLRLGDELADRFGRMDRRHLPRRVPCRRVPPLRGCLRRRAGARKGRAVRLLAPVRGRRGVVQRESLAVEGLEPGISRV